MSRRLARETALQVLFQVDMTGDNIDKAKTVSKWAEEFTVPENSVPFAQELVEGTLLHKEEIDKKIAAYAQGWSIDRMATVDRNLLRLATYEVLYRTDIPGRVTLNEAVELAKRYGGEDSAKFINGIMDRIVDNTDKRESESKRVESLESVKTVESA
ncbi:MAG: transcription antitermination factor NusB, partial [Desulfitobacterium hafniense]|nr:transcription antitermination factor NusB [Desulfitobacterium hafniense]